MKKQIIRTDNYGMSGEAPGKDEKFVLWPMSELACEQIVDILNRETHDLSPNYYKVVGMDYKLKTFEP